MKFIKTKKGIAFLAAIAAIAISAVGAYAYFTSTGHGTGSATVGTSTALTITQTGSISGLTPNGPIVPVAYTINNPTANGAQNLGLVSASITTIDQTVAGQAAGTCTAADFNLLPATSAVGTVAAGGTFNSATATEPTIQMIDTSANQDGCQGATVHLSLDAAQGA